MTDTETVQLAHGGGGGLARELIDREIVARFGDGPLAGLPDAARLPSPPGDLIFTTDSFVVQPMEFPGGNIGSLAVHGTVNDLAVSGGNPLWISLALIMEEGLPLELLRRILDSVKSAADNCGVTVATGDTKVVGRGQCDGLYINTAGIAGAIPGFSLSPSSISRGDHVVVSGPLGDHGMAVLASRQGIDIENGPDSDSGPVHRLVAAARPWAESVRFMRDPTRGGLAAVLNEAVENRDVGVLLQQDKIPLSIGASAVSELLGMDPLHVASEGRAVAFCAPEASQHILKAWRSLPEGKGSVMIGTVDDQSGLVVMETVAGGRRLVDTPRGELLPRIC